MKGLYPLLLKRFINDKGPAGTDLKQDAQAIVAVSYDIKHGSPVKSYIRKRSP